MDGIRFAIIGFAEPGGPRCSLLTSRSIFVPATGAPRSSRRTKMGRDARRSRLEKHPTDLRQKTCYFGDRTLACRTHIPRKVC
jgi:hypothetical protein